MSFSPRWKGTIELHEINRAVQRLRGRIHSRNENHDSECSAESESRRMKFYSCVWLLLSASDALEGLVSKLRLQMPALALAMPKELRSVPRGQAGSTNLGRRRGRAGGK